MLSSRHITNMCSIQCGSDFATAWSRSSEVSTKSKFSLLERNYTVPIILPQRFTYVAYQTSYVNWSLDCCDAIVLSDALRPRLPTRDPKSSSGFLWFYWCLMGPFFRLFWARVGRIAILLRVCDCVAILAIDVRHVYMDLHRQGQ